MKKRRGNRANESAREKQAFTRQQRALAKRIENAKCLPEYSVRIMSLRHAMHSTQTEFAKIFGIGQPVISAWESGRYPPSAESYILLGNLARDDESLWFWEQAGIERGGLLTAATRMLLRSGFTVKPEKNYAPAQKIAKEINLKDMWHTPPGETKPFNMGTFAGKVEISTGTASRILEVPAGEVTKLVQLGEIKGRHIVAEGAPIIDLESLLRYLSKSWTPQEKAEAWARFVSYPSRRVARHRIRP